MLTQTRLALSSPLFLFLFLIADVVTAAGSLSGMVTDYDTDIPLEDIQVNLYRSEDPNFAGESAWIPVTSGFTDTNGEYVFTNLEARQYRIHIRTGTTDSSGKHFVQADLYHVQVFDNTETPDMNLLLREAGYIWGYVRTEGGIPIPGALVIGHGEWTEDGPGWHWVTTDQTGLYKLWLLPSPGAFYTVSTQGGWLSSQYAAQYAPDLYQATIQGVHGPDFALAEGGCVQGRIINDQGKGIPNVEVDPKIGILDDPDTWTDDSGHYTLFNLPATDQAYVYIDQWDLMPVVLDGVKYASGERFVGPLTVTPGQTCTQAPDMVMMIAGAIEGVVTDTAGIPIVGAEMEIEGFDAEGYRVDDGEIYTDALGQYTLDFLPPGQYTLRADKDGWIMTVQSRVVVVSGELTDADLVMRKADQGTIVSGKVSDYQTNTCFKDSAGILIPNYIDNEDYSDQTCGNGIVAFPSDFVFRVQEPFTLLGEGEIADGYANYFQPQPAETVGDYQMALPPGSLEAVLYTWHFTDRGESVIFHDHRQWSLANGETLSGQDLLLPPSVDTGVLEGVINYPTGASFNPDMTVVFAFNEGTSSSFSLGDAFATPLFSPAYRFGRLPAGNYTLQVISMGFVDQTYEDITVASGVTTVQDITLETGATLNGSITDAVSGQPLPGAWVEIIDNGKTDVSDNTGNYSVSGLAAEDYNLLVSKPGYANYSGVVTITLPATDYDIALDSLAGSITGLVLDENAAPINGAQVVAYNPALNSHKSGLTLAGEFTLSDLPAGEYVLGINAPGYTTVHYPANGLLSLNPEQALNIANPIVVNPTPPLFSSTSSVSEAAGVKSLSVTLSSDLDLLSDPTVMAHGQETVTGCSSFNWQSVTAAKLVATCEVAAGETLVWIDISEGSIPVIAGNPASASFSFEVATNLLNTSTTNLFNAIGGDSTIMGTQDNTKVYVPPFALTGTDTQAVKLTVKRYGDPGDALSNNDNQTVSAVYDFSFEDSGVKIDTNHVVTITLQFEKPVAMTQADFEADLKIGYFRVNDQQWVYHTDSDSGISNLHINWLNNTITFEASHFTRFAAFLPAITQITGDYDQDGDVDRDDLAILLLDRNKTVEASNCGSACDLDSDGMITVLDARKLFLLCSRSRCATE
jgi:hypothetical protein